MRSSSSAWVQIMEMSSMKRLQVWLLRRMSKCVCREFSKEQISVWWSHACSHICAVCLDVEGVVKFKTVHSS